MMMVILRYKKKCSSCVVEIYLFISSVLINSQIVLANNNNNTLDTLLCGYIDFSGSKVNVYQGLGISPSIKFDDIYKSFTNTTIIVPIKNDDNCFIEICGHPTILHPDHRAIIPSCTRFWAFNFSLALQSDPFQLKYEATSIECGCNKKNERPNCERQECDKLPFNGTTTICAVLYEENNCKDCIFDGRILSQDGIFNTSNSAVIRSAYVQPNCTLYETAYGYSYYSLPDFPVQKFIPFTVEHGESSQIVPMHTRRGQNFYCTCPKVDNNEIEEIDGNPNTEPFSTIMAWGLGSLGFLMLLLTASALLIKRHYWEIKNKPLVIVPKSEIVQFWKGAVANAVHLSEDDDNQEAPGVVQACFAPYDPNLEISRDDLDFKPANPKILGNGMFGIVFKAKYKGKCNNKLNSENKIWMDVAIKTVKPYSECGYIKSILNEVKVLAYLQEEQNHPNIVKLLGACTNNLEVGEVYIVLELCSNGCLKNHLISIKDSLPKQKVEFKKSTVLPDYFEEKIDKPRHTPDLGQPVLLQLFKWSKEIATGMEFLAQKNVLHIDLACRNILLDENLICKIADFGLSRKLYAKQDYTKYSREPVPTKGNALECLTRKKYSTKSDVWSYGVALWEIFSLGENPYGNFECQDIIDFLNSGNRLSCPTYANMEIYEKTMLACWDEKLENALPSPSFANFSNKYCSIMNHKFSSTRNKTVSVDIVETTIC